MHLIKLYDINVQICLEFWLSKVQIQLITLDERKNVFFFQKKKTRFVSWLTLIMMFVMCAAIDALLAKSDIFRRIRWPMEQSSIETVHAFLIWFAVMYIFIDILIDRNVSANVLIQCSLELFGGNLILEYSVMAEKNRRKIQPEWILIDMKRERNAIYLPSGCYLQKLSIKKNQSIQEENFEYNSIPTISSTIHIAKCSNKYWFNCLQPMTC